MIRLGRFACISMMAIALVLTGCNHPDATDSGPNSPGPIQTSPAKPSITSDETSWGNYLSEQGKRHGKDVGMKPYIYVIPSGDSVAANNRRQNEMDSIIHSIGPVLMPGGMLILGGPNSKQTTAFVTDLSKQLKADAMKGIVVMVVSDASEQNADRDALKSSGATVRFVTM